jgi:uncharacterized protein (DUF2147 family)
MRRHSFALLAAILAAFAFSAPAFAQDTGADIYGVWATPKNDGKVAIEPCGNAICGRVLDGRQLRANPNQTDVYNPDQAMRSRRILGLHILEGYSGGPKEWAGGTVYDPQTGDSSSDSTITMTAPNTLVVKGCRLVFCRSETWVKVQNTASSGR